MDETYQLITQDVENGKVVKKVVGTFPSKKKAMEKGFELMDEPIKLKGMKMYRGPFTVKTLEGMENKQDILYKELSKKKVKDMSVVDLHNLIIDCLKRYDSYKEINKSIDGKYEK